tara:strand:- start:180 stop:458 length:279 start_codon:yes stop_codon:yes gene_type:complete
MKHWEVVDDFGDSIRIEWNESATFNIQEPKGGEWVDYHCFTHYGIDNENDALEIALEHLAEEEAACWTLSENRKEDLLMLWKRKIILKEIAQ